MKQTNSTNWQKDSTVVFWQMVILQFVIHSHKFQLLGSVTLVPFLPIHFSCFRRYITFFVIQDLLCQLMHMRLVSRSPLKFFLIT